MVLLPPPHASLPARLLPDTTTISDAGVLHIANHSLADLAQQYGTPLYIFDRATIEHACQRYWQAFRDHYACSQVHIIYASKAYLSPIVARLMAEQDMGLDVVSGGELMVAQRANFPMERISFHGNNKSEDELRLAIRLGVGRFVLDNWSEVVRLSRIAEELNTRPAVLLRVAPDVETDTHKYLQTGHASAKFGFPLMNGEAKQAILQILHEQRLRLVGLHAHTGTMLRETRPYEESLERLLVLAAEVHEAVGWWPEEVSPGGGWAIDAVDNSEPMPGVDVLAQALQQCMERVTRRLAKPAPTLIIEPGRSLIARAGVTVYRIGARKATPGGITYLFVDGGMADNIRPALYGAVYTAFAVERANEEAVESMCVSGRYCESGDMLIEKVALPHLEAGELLLLPTTGAYCLPMASNYNLVPRPCVLLVEKQKVHIMEHRETYENLLARYG